MCSASWFPNSLLNSLVSFSIIRGSFSLFIFRLKLVTGDFNAKTVSSDYDYPNDVGRFVKGLTNAPPPHSSQTIAEGKRIMNGPEWPTKKESSKESNRLCHHQMSKPPFCDQCLVIQWYHYRNRSLSGENHYENPMTKNKIKAHEWKNWHHKFLKPNYQGHIKEHCAR